MVIDKNVKLGLAALVAIVAALFIVQFFVISAKLGQAEREIIACKKMIQQKDGDMQKLTDQLVLKQKELEAAKKDTEAGKEELEGVKKELEGVKAGLNNAKKVLTNAKKELVNTKKELEAVKTQPEVTAAQQ